MKYDFEKIKKLYYENKLSFQKIAENVGCKDGSNFHKKFLKLGLETRNEKEAALLRHRKGIIP